MTLHAPINYTTYLSEYEDATNTSRFVIIIQAASVEKSEALCIHKQISGVTWRIALIASQK